MGASRSDIWAGIGLLAFCGFVAWRTLLVRTVASGTIAGPVFVPWLMIGGLSLLAIALILRSILRGSSAVELPTRRTLVRMGLLALLLVAYAAAFEPLGYLVSTLVTFVLGLLLFNERRPLVLILVPLALTGGVYLGFTRLLQVWLP
ncbi:tripartite tricarboxylate transporter TctB family protein [Rhodobacter sphaeroides]|uniref:tripartite tricarboxylate transporter TctB family protein n=1 Tax=Cereibacter sphaeroides TaxID=1063 RepID=UPI0013288C23|nr:tripartite tricarboxylate transporter TctB family protein [Cereibacter sphaeroides]MWP38008.1 tripartite tricarboxylate transporter TctB family protein [Cereibacter sphaeroides]